MPLPSKWNNALLTLLTLQFLAFVSAQDSAQETNASEAQVDFRRDIQPILGERCYQCHGPKKQKAGLRLDLKGAALAGSDLGSIAVILPGKAAESILLQRVQSDDADERMPPRGKPLSTEQIDLLSRWIDQGAVWPDDEASSAVSSEHWAYNAPEHRPLPNPAVNTWVRNEIDTFVLARLQEQAWSPAPETDRNTLLRRLSLDLTGLPPTLSELADFGQDNSPEAYERQVDRLLASEHFGEHQARYWLDLARYADTNGYEKDERRSIWPYRDWIIDAFNTDMGFDRFSIEQLAGDLLPQATQEQKIATGFHRNTMINAEGGVDPEEDRVAAVIDRVNTTAAVWMGSTLACAQCHTHKYDPFSHRDYYRLFAYFNSSSDVGPSDGPRLSVPSQEQAALEEQALAETARLEEETSAWTPALEERLLEFIEQQKNASAEWHPARPTRFESQAGSTLALLNEGSLLAIGDVPPEDTYELQFDFKPGVSLRRLRLEILPHASLPGGGTSRASHQNFVLNEVRLSVISSDENVAPRNLTLSSARADFHQTGPATWPAEDCIDGDPATGWAIGGAVGKAHTLELELEEALALGTSEKLQVQLAQTYGAAHLIGHVRFSRSASASNGSNPLPRPISQLLRQRASPTQEEESLLRAWYQANAPSLSSARARLAKLKQRPAPPTTLVMEELETPRPSHILERGSFLSPAAQVLPGVPMVLPQQAPDEAPNRLGLARWLMQPNNPLTARVRVNQLWAQVFGRGLVATSEDFGTQGDRPSHPALLDWLALSFQEGGWSTKQLLRQIVLSATYRQSSVASAERRLADPQNRWLARASRYRVDAEVIRDIALSASGLLSPSIGGPSVFPPQPEGVWNVTYSQDRWVAAVDAQRFRRGLYTFWRRTAPYPAFMAFDSTSRELACVRRPSSNTPLQALALLNDPAMVEAAVALGARMLRAEGATDEDRMALGFLICTGQQAGPEELQTLGELLRSERESYAANPEAARQLLWSEANLGVQDLQPVELAPWAVLGNVLLNLDETITRN